MTMALYFLNTLTQVCLWHDKGSSDRVNQESCSGSCGKEGLSVAIIIIINPLLLLSLSAMLTQSHCNSYIPHCTMNNLHQHHDDNNKDKNNKNDNLATGLRECGMPGHSGDSKLACKFL